MTWSISATQPRPTTLPSITNTSVSKAKCINKTSAYGKKYTSSKMRSLSSQRVKRLTRLSGLVRSGILVATLGSWVLLLPTIPLMSAASVVKCLATGLVCGAGYHCVKASRMARYRRRLSLIVCSLLDWSRFPARVYDETTSNYTLQSYLAKVSGREVSEKEQPHEEQ